MQTFMTFNNSHRPTVSGQKSERNSKSKPSLAFKAVKNISESTERQRTASGPFKANGYVFVLDSWNLGTWKQQQALLMSETDSERSSYREGLVTYNYKSKIYKGPVLLQEMQEIVMIR